MLQKISISKWMLFFWTFYSSTKMYDGFHKNIKKQLFSALTIIRNMYWAANHHIIMSSEEEDDAENSALHHRNKLLLKIYSNRKHLF